MRPILRAILLLPLLATIGLAEPTTQPAATEPVGKLPHIIVDAKHKMLRVDCFAVVADYPLEFLAVVSNTNEYEAIVRSDAKPSDLHLGLLMLGLKPGSPAHYSEAEDKWIPPSGAPVAIYFEYQKEGKTIRVPAYQWMRDMKTKKPCGDFTWCFTGSRFLTNGEYGANATGQLIGVVNNDLTVVDVPGLQSSAMESRQWERNTDAMPPANTPVTMIITPAPPDKDAATRPTTGPGK